MRRDRDNPYPTPNATDLERKILRHIMSMPIRCRKCNWAVILPFKVAREFDCSQDRYIFKVFSRCTFCKALYTKTILFPRSKYLAIDDIDFKTLGKMYKTECPKNKHIYG